MGGQPALRFTYQIMQPNSARAILVPAANRDCTPVGRQRHTELLRPRTVPNSLPVRSNHVSWVSRERQARYTSVPSAAAEAATRPTGWSNVAR